MMGTLLDRWLVQVTSVSLRVLQICPCGELVKEWMPNESFPEMKKQGITLAVLNNETIVIASVETIYAIMVTDKGLPQIMGSRSYPHEVSSLETCSLQLPSDPKMYDTEVTLAISVVVIGQWSSNTVSILRLPDLEALATVDCDSAAPVRSSNLVELRGTHYLFVGMANGDLLYFTLQIFQYTDADQGRRQTNDDYELQLNDSAKEKETCTHFLSSKSAFPLQRDFVFTHNTNKFILQTLNKSCLRVGSSEVSFLVGNFSGMHKPSFMSKSVLIQTAENAVLLVKNSYELKAYGVHGETSLMTSTARIHTEAYPHSLISVSRSGQLLIFHLVDLPNLCWDKLHLGGTPCHLVYHEQSHCAVVSCLEIQSSKVVFVHMKSLCKVLCMEVGGFYRPSFMGAVDLPCLENIGVIKQYLLLGSYLHDNALGTLAILDFQTFSPGKQQMQYELHLLARLDTEIPCHCFCVFSAAEHGSQGTILNRHKKQGTSTKWQTMLAVGGFGKVHLYFLMLKLEKSSLHFEIESILEFESPGKRNITSLSALSDGTLLVVEELYGVSIFEMHDLSSIAPIAVQLFNNPIQAAMPISEHTILMAVYSEGLKVMKRNNEEEVAYKIEKIRMEEMKEKLLLEEYEHESPSGNAHTRDLLAKFMARSLPGLFCSAAVNMPFAAFRLLCGNFGIHVDSCIQTSGEKVDCNPRKHCAVVITPFGEIGCVTLTKE